MNHRHDPAPLGLPYHGLDRAALDREYDNRKKVDAAELAAMTERGAQRSDAARRKRKCDLDVAYGPSAAERLDVFAADSPNRGSVEVFFHGGYWWSRNKRDFSFIADGFAPHGVTTVIVGYGLIPTVTMGELVEQCRRALEWVARHIGRYGGDPQRIHVCGHSAGGHIVAMMMATDWTARGLPAQLLSGACGISGLYDLEPIRLCFLNDTLRLSDDDVARYSPVRLPRTQQCLLRLPVGGLEGAEYLRQSKALATTWAEAIDDPEVIVVPGANHYSIRDELGDPRSRMVEMVLRDRLGAR